MQEAEKVSAKKSSNTKNIEDNFEEYSFLMELKWYFWTKDRNEFK